MNSVKLFGRVGRQPDSKFLPSGTQVVNFSLATTERFKKDGQKHEKTTWHNLVLFGKTAELAEKFINKGDQLLIEGKIDNRSYDGNDGVKKYVSEVVVSTLHFVSTGQNTEQSHQQPAQQQNQGGHNHQQQQDQGYQNQKNPTYGEPGPRESQFQQNQQQNQGGYNQQQQQQSPQNGKPGPRESQYNSEQQQNQGGGGMYQEPTFDPDSDIPF